MTASTCKRFESSWRIVDTDGPKLVLCLFVFFLRCCCCHCRCCFSGYLFRFSWNLLWSTDYQFAEEVSMTSTHTTNLSHARHTNDVHFGSRFELHPLKNQKNNFCPDERTKAVMTTITAVECRKTGRISQDTRKSWTKRRRKRSTRRLWIWIP